MSRTSIGSSSHPDAESSGLPPVPTTGTEVRAALARLEIRPSRGMGQSFLTDPFVADAEAALVELPPGHPVFEIGGGFGQLTSALLRRKLGPLTVIERDARLARFLRRTFGERITVLEGDALELPLPRAEVAVGNLPYSIATPLLLRLFEARVPRVVFLVQEEVARRLAAEPGSKDYGRLSIIAQLYGTVELFRTVPPSAFTPVPQVTSRIGVHVARAEALPVPSVPAFVEMVRRLFSSRRKQLRNLMPRVIRAPTTASRLTRTAGWPEDWPARRPETLPPESYFALARAIASDPPSG
ncbi:MAG: 16S rRNA (adenine(1518)-N(6)/adenine(1519)-N(6))-dimethyltransferase RsmA [Thermoplasmata archaeon]|nr:16S rRNA (adenine(1518)-N(6)/adenine(1519)-N(6))-dimethyltransferase RsmA [Thermoplasmata archaeon]